MNTSLYASKPLHVQETRSWFGLSFPESLVRRLSMSTKTVTIHKNITSRHCAHTKNWPRTQPTIKTFQLTRIHLTCSLRTCTPLLTILYSSSGCFSLNLGFGVGFFHLNPEKGSLPKLQDRTATVLVRSVKLYPHFERALFPEVLFVQKNRSLEGLV